MNSEEVLVKSIEQLVENDLGDSIEKTNFLLHDQTGRKMRAESILSEKEFHTETSSESILNSLSETVDVVIIGAGTTGLTLACELAKRSVNFTILDILPESFKHSKSILILPRTLELLADLGLVKEVIQLGHTIRGLQLHLNGRDPLGEKFSNIMSPFPFMLSIEESVILNLLRMKLHEMGHTVAKPVAAWKIEVGNKDREAGSVEEKYDFVSPVEASPISFVTRQSRQNRAKTASSSSRSINGENCVYNCNVHVKAVTARGRAIGDTIIRCNFLIGCDGAQSSVRRALKLDFKQKIPAVECQLADVQIIWKKPFDLHMIHFIKKVEGDWVIIPKGDKRWRILIISHSLEEKTVSFKQPRPMDIVDLQLLVLKVLPGSVIEKLFWSSRFFTTTYVAESFYRSFGVLAGDAAHTHVPFLGQSMNSGMQDAYNLGWKLAALVKGAPLKLLESYSTERLEAAEQIHASNFISSIFPAMRYFPLMEGNSFFGNWNVWSNFTSKVLNIYRMNLARYPAILSQLEIRYSSNSIIGEHRLGRDSTATPGTRFPHCTVVVLPTPGETHQSGVSETTTEIRSVTRGGSHTLILCVKVLPPGMKEKTIFGCERKEDAPRWNKECLDNLIKISRVLVGSIRGGDSEILWGGVKVVWVLCGLVNFKGCKNTVGFGRVKDHVPNRVKSFLLQRSSYLAETYITVDYQNEVICNLNLRLSDPGCRIGAKNSGAFFLLRPDEHISHNGFAGDAVALSMAFDYTVSCSGI